MTQPTARLIESDTQLDLLDVSGEDGFLFEASGSGIAGTGEAVRLDLEYERPQLSDALNRVSTALRDIPVEGSAVPLAFVCIPFVNSAPILAVVPERVVRSFADGQSITTVSAQDLPRHSRGFDQSLRLEPPKSFKVEASRSAKEWCDAVDEAVRRLRRGDLDKVALARELVVEADSALSQLSILSKLRTSYPSAFRYAIDGFIGASPELLIERQGMNIHSQPMAGTVARGSGPDSDKAVRDGLLNSGKDLSEHRFLVDMVRETLSPYCVELDAPEVPEVVSLANVHHLATSVSGRLEQPTGVLDLVAALHPTPAVGGRPTEAAIELIAELEDLDRGRYAGAVGWVDANGDGCFAVAIRCAQLKGSTARLYAGNGIVAASDSQRELEETQAKFQAMLTAIIRP